MLSVKPRLLIARLPQAGELGRIGNGRLTTKDSGARRENKFDGDIAGAGINNMQERQP